MGVSYTAANNILCAATGKSQYAYLANTSYIGLFTAEPVNQGQQVNFQEVPRVITLPGSDTTVNTGYARMNIGQYQGTGTQKMDTLDPVTMTMKNKETIFFNEAEQDWGTITHFGIFASASDSAPLFWGALTTPTTVNQGYVAIFKKDQLTMQLA